MKLEASVTVRLGGVTILNGVELDFDVGESVAIIGPNGAGKSTLLRALSSLVEFEGKVMLNGRSTGDLDRRSLAREVAFVGQSRAPAFDYSVMEFVLMGLNARKDRFALESASDREAAQLALRKVELEVAADRGVQTLSGGEYQRCVIARTMLTNTDVWLLDEPTSDLDPKYQLRIHQLIRERAGQGALTITVLHDLHQAARFHERVVLIVDGEVRADGPPDDVLQTSVLETAYGVEIQRVDTEYGPLFVPV